MKRKRTLVVGTEVVYEVERKVRHEHISKAAVDDIVCRNLFFAYRAPDWLDRIARVIEFPYWHIRKALYEHRKKSAANGRAGE